PKDGSFKQKSLTNDRQARLFPMCASVGPRAKRDIFQPETSTFFRRPAVKRATPFTGAPRAAMKDPRGPRQMTKLRRCAALLTSLLVSSFSRAALSQQAQGFALDRFEPSERGSEWFALESLDLRGDGRLAFGVV